MKLTWPLVALLGVLLGATVAILVLVPEDDTRGRALVVALTTGISAILAGVYVKTSVERKLDENNNDAGDEDEEIEADTLEGEAR